MDVKPRPLSRMKKLPLTCEIKLQIHTAGTEGPSPLLHSGDRGTCGRGGGEAGASGGAVRGQQLSCAAQHCAVAPRGTNPGVLALGKGTAPLPGPLVKGFGNEILPEARAISKQFPLPYIFRKIKCRFIIIIIITFPFKECLLHIFFRSLSLRF